MDITTITKIIAIAERATTPENEANAAAIKAFSAIRAQGISLTDLLKNRDIAVYADTPSSVLIMEKIRVDTENLHLKKENDLLKAKVERVTKRLDQRVEDIEALKAQNRALRKENKTLKATKKAEPKDRAVEENEPTKAEAGVATSPTPAPEKEVVFCSEWGPNAEVNDYNGEDPEAVAITKDWVDDRSVRKFLKARLPFTFTVSADKIDREVEDDVREMLGDKMIDMQEIHNGSGYEGLTFDRYRRCVEDNMYYSGAILFRLAAKWDWYPTTRKAHTYNFYFKTEADMVLAKLAM